MMSNDSVKCKAFISEAEVETIRQKRQEEWDKVRKPEDPLEVPEEEYDPRSLFERLQEEKDRRQLELDESRRLKNLIKGLDDDEVAFLELVDQTKVDMETRLWQEERKEIQEYRRAVSSLTEDEAEARLHHMRRSLNINNTGCGKKSQQSLLAGALKRKASSASPEKRKCPSSGRSTESEENIVESSDCSDSKKVKSADETLASPTKVQANKERQTIACLGVLPGLGVYYSDSSDSENSSLSDVVEKDSEFDLVGRRRIQLLQEAQQCIKAVQQERRS